MKKSKIDKDCILLLAVFLPDNIKHQRGTSGSIAVCGVYQVNEVENLASHMCRVCMYAVYSAEFS